MIAKAAIANADVAQDSLARVYVDRSSIHGFGVFAREPIAAGETIGRFEGVETEKDGRYVLWIEDEHARFRGIEGTTDLRFVNHSRSPNAEFVEDLLIALEPIGPGDEITCHYGESWEEANEWR